jgi:hypothetical protein
MGVLGTEDSDGDFKVVDVCYIEPPPQEQLDLMETGTPSPLFFARLYYDGIQPF